jgi:hypothetical protein
MRATAESQPWLTWRRQTLRMPLAYYCTCVIWLLCIAGEQRMWHWFVVPVLLCGLLIGPDAIRWLSGEYDLFDPKGIAGGYGWYLFFVAPLLFIRWDVGMTYVDNPPDWRPWVGYLAILSVLALLLYRYFYYIGFRRPSLEGYRRWRIEIKLITPMFLVFCVVALISLLYYFSRVGGVSGIIEAKTLDLQRPSGIGLFEFAGNALPILVLIYLSLRKIRPSPTRISFLRLTVLFLLLGGAQFLLGGLKGSRSATIWSLFWMAGIIHYFWRPIDRRVAVLCLPILLVFMYLYGFYKSAGADAVDMLVAGSKLDDIEAVTGRTWQQGAIGDLSRVDTQSYELYRLSGSTDYALRWGKTYIGALIIFTPSWLWPERPADTEKVVAGTDLLHGSDVYVAGDKSTRSSRVYGLAGEAMLNFGAWSAPLPFAIWGLLLGRYRRALLTWERTDVRRLLAPFVALIFVEALTSDFDNLLVAFVSKGSFVMLFILVSVWRSMRSSVS